MAIWALEVRSKDFRMFILEKIIQCLAVTIIQK